MDILWIRLIHILVIGLFLIWIGVAVPDVTWIYPIIFVIGAALLVYWLATLRDQDIFWTVWHLLMAFVLCWIGLWGHGSPRFFFKILVIIGAAAIGYHLVGLVRDRYNALMSR
jgi:hypothetical protein